MRLFEGHRAIPLALALVLLAPAASHAVERDLQVGLAYLRVGAQREAELHLTRYRDGERDPEIRASVDRMLPLMQRALAADVREYIATTLEDSIRLRTQGQRYGPRPGYAYWIFPVFP